MQIVCVTGVGGFIASWIVKGLLDRGHRVRGTVRKLSKGAPHLQSVDGAKDRLELCEGDLLKEGSFDAAATGCGTVIHTASPYVLDVKDPQKDLVDPAVKGTLNVLEACAKSPSVKRVVLTSSIAAITDEPENDKVLTDADWNTKSTLARNPYYLSKTLAERAAWDFMATRKPQFDLVAVNPFFVFGPSLTAELNTTNQIFADMLNGTFPGILNLSWGMVDVRDVAESHIRAMDVPGAHGRYICANDAVPMRTVVEWMIEFGYAESYKLPTLGMDCAIGDYVVKLGSYMQPKGVGTYLRTHIGKTPLYDTSKIRQELGVVFRPLKDSVRETLADLKKWGHI